MVLQILDHLVGADILDHLVGAVPVGAINAMPVHVALVLVLPPWVRLVASEDDNDHDEKE